MKNLNYKKKCYLLASGFLFVLYFGWNLSFSDTFTLASKIKDNEKKLLWLKEKEQEISLLQENNGDLEINRLQNDSGDVRDRLTAFISDFSEKNNCLVTEIPSNTSFQNASVRVQTNTFTVRGNFNKLVKLLNQVENDCKYIAKIMSASFSTATDARTKKKELFLTLITQSFN